MRVWVYTERDDDQPNMTIEVYDTHAAACSRLKKEVENYFGRPFDEIEEIPYAWPYNETLYVNADSVEYWNANYGTIHWDVDEREIICE